MVELARNPRAHQLRLLAEEHQALQARLAELGRHITLTAAEKVEYAVLKKRKLAMKDRMRRLEQR